MHDWIKNYLLRNKFEFLFAVLIIYFLAASFLDSQLSQAVFGLLFAFVILTSLLVVSGAKRLLFGSAIVLSLVIVVVILAEPYSGAQSVQILQFTLSAVFLLLITGACALTTFRYERVDAQTLFGALCTYLFMGLTWSQFYLLIHAVDAQAFSMPNTIHLAHHASNTFAYYSYVTLSTLGFGDITPLSPIARTLSWLEAVVGQAYLTILIAQIVGQYIAQRKDNS